MLSGTLHHAFISSYLSFAFCRSKSSTQVTAVASAQVAEQEAAVAAAAVPDWVYDPNEPRYCLCNQVSGFVGGQRVAYNSISYPESSASLASGWSPGDTLRNRNLITAGFLRLKRQAVTRQPIKKLI